MIQQFVQENVWSSHAEEQPVARHKYRSIASGQQDSEYQHNLLPIPSISTTALTVTRTTCGYKPEAISGLPLMLADQTIHHMSIKHNPKRTV